MEYYDYRIDLKLVISTDRLRDIQNPANMILPINEYCISDFVLFLSRIVGCRYVQKTLICNTALLTGAS